MTVLKKPTADRQRVTDDFLELISLDSESLQEREIADRLKEKFRGLGCTVEEDDVAERIGGSCGNLYIRSDGTDSDRKPILFSAHMDTVVPGKGKEARILEDGRIIGNGEAVLGADDVTGIVEILEGIRILKETGIPHRPVEILLTPSEETFGRGAVAFDLSKIEAEDVYVMDLTGPIGKAAVQAPSLIMFRAKITGRAAHAGFEPEKGVNAIRVASKAIAGLRQGRIDEDTTFNIGRIDGGKVTNIVPDMCRITGEIRSYDHEKAERIAAETEAAFRREAEPEGAGIEFKTNVLIKAYHIDENEEVCRRFLRALDMIGLGDRKEPFVSTFGGSDNNVFTLRGKRGIVVSSGMYEPHSLDEYTTVEDLVRGAELVAALCMV